MAIEKTVKINVDTHSAVNAMDSLSKATHDVSQSFEEVYGDLQPLTTRMGEAEDRLYELANAGKTTTKEYKDLLKTVGDYRKVQINTDLAVDSAASTMNQRLGGALSGVTSGFSVATGVMGTFGAESEEVEKLLLRVNAAMAMAQGLQGLREATPMFREMGNAAKLALNGIKTGIAATGIGLLVIALGTIYAYWDDIIGAVSGVSVEQENLNNLTAHNLTVEKDKYDALSLQDNALRLQGKSEKEILQIKKKQIDAVILAAEVELQSQHETKNAQIAAAKRNKEIAQGIIRFMTTPITILLKGVDALTYGLSKIGVLAKGTNLEEGFSGGLAKMIFDPKETAEKADATIKESKAALNKLRSDRDGFELSIQSNDKKQVQSNTNKNNSIAKNNKQAGDDKLAAEKKATEEANKFKKEAETEFLNQIEAIQEENWQNTLTQQEREEQAVAAKYFTIEQLAKGNAEQLAIIETAKNAELKVITDKAAADKLVADEKKAAADKEIADKEIEVEKALADTKKTIRDKDIENIQNGINVISDLFEGNKKVQAVALIAQNAVAIAKAIIETKAANVAARATGTALSLATGGASVVAAESLVLRNNISTGISIAGIAAATAKGLSALKSGGSAGGGGNLSDGGGGSGGGSGGAITPSFNVVGNSGINQLAQIQQQPTPVKTKRLQQSH